MMADLFYRFDPDPIAGSVIPDGSCSSLKVLPDGSLQIRNPIVHAKQVKVSSELLKQ